MAYNYGNLTNIESMLPLFGSITGGNSLASTPNFLNQLTAVVTTSAAVVQNISTTPTTSVATNRKRTFTPDPPPPPKFSLSTSKVNQGTAPMDLELDNDMDLETLMNNTISTSSLTTLTTATKPADKLPLNALHESNLYLNGLIPASASGYMFFPTPAATSATATNTPTTTGSMLVDPSVMMAAMQQIQQTYAGYTMAAESSTTEGTPVSTSTDTYTAPGMKEMVKTKSCILFPPNPNAPPPSIRERPPGCRTVFVGGLPENITEEIIREIFESCGEITTLRMSKKNFCHIRYRQEASIDRAIYLSGYRVRISNINELANFGRLHVDYAQARDDQYDYECKQRQLQREQRHRERKSFDRLRSQSPPPLPHYSDHEASIVAENLRNNDTFVKAVQTIAVWLERGDCTKRNANVFYSMIQSTHAHVRRLHTDKQQLEDDLRKAREVYRKQMLCMSTQFTQIEKVFSAASHKKVWDHFTKAQRKNIDQWKKLASELRSIQIEDDEMEMSDDDRDYPTCTSKRARYDSDNLKEENDSLRCQLEAIRNEMSLERTDIKCSSDFREKQIKVLQETIRNMQTQLLQTKTREQKDSKIIEHLERRLKEASVKELLLKTAIKKTKTKLKEKLNSPINSDTSEKEDEENDECRITPHDEVRRSHNKRLLDPVVPVIDVDVYKSDDDVKIIEQTELKDVVEIHVLEDDDKTDRIVQTEQHSNSSPDTQAISPPSPLITTAAAITTTTTINTPIAATAVTTTESIEMPTTTNGIEDTTPATLDTLETSELISLSLAEAKIIALAAAYLVVHPHGVSADAIAAYLSSVIKCETMKTKYLEDILCKYTNIFKAETMNTTTNIKWIFCGYGTTDDAPIDH